VLGDGVAITTYCGRTFEAASEWISVQILADDKNQSYIKCKNDQDEEE